MRRCWSRNGKEEPEQNIFIKWVGEDLSCQSVIYKRCGKQQSDPGSQSCPKDLGVQSSLLDWEPSFEFQPNLDLDCFSLCVQGMMQL